MGVVKLTKTDWLVVLYSKNSDLIQLHTTFKFYH